ncbi:hypothetical protein SERLA73DRAFT_155017 [Serpula lacrymans var. lacrymans S7.3]|uniref:GPI anchored protein n=2 Tax=Serpula lacrymans var. lacrymans TaxID=341189 RepID=F8Q7Z8_SERL3|nr:uncharacterized protein SERLADRAFT_398719 [Serpula lacrymans var. lacrymans S7.9]EGN95686.1 hypothetical protein SERLA73DRAFT_155017 [Serpula lacrymans var. lacrymans S7.3]EGO21212.1 hypothetical protein SERLADRAFT_398719 [Serpula lacrymans var. lacrymans S7.9]
MALMKTLIIFSFVAFCSADISLYLPDFDSEPFSVNVLGVGSDGQTTYEVFPAEPTGTSIGQTSAFVDTAIATLVEGPSSFVLNYDYPQVSVIESCNIANGLESCKINMMATTITYVQIATPMLVEGGGSASPMFTGPMFTGGTTMYYTNGIPVTSTVSASASMSAPTASPTASGAVPGSGSSAGSAQTSASSPAPTQTNGSTMMTLPRSILMGVIGVVGISLGFI